MDVRNTGDLDVRNVPGGVTIGRLLKMSGHIRNYCEMRNTETADETVIGRVLIRGNEMAQYTKYMETQTDEEKMDRAYAKVGKRLGSEERNERLTRTQ